MAVKYKLLARFVKDVSVEPPNIETYIFVNDYISKYNFNLDIYSIAVKDKVIEVNTKLSLSDPNIIEKKSYFDIIFATVIKMDDDLKEKKESGKIILCDFQNKIYSDIEKTFFKLVVNSGYPERKPTKKIDFNELYNSRQNSKLFFLWEFFIKFL
jgi:hypothetical protein